MLGIFQQLQNLLLGLQSAGEELMRQLEPDDESPAGRKSIQSLQLQIEDGRPPRESLFGDAFRLGVAYLLLATLFFGISSYIPGPEPYKHVPAGFAGHSVLVEIMSGLTSFFIMSVAVWHLRKNRMIHNLMMCFFISAVVSIADFISRRELYIMLYATDNLNMDNIQELFMCWAMFFGWSSVFLTLLYSFDVRDRERQLAAVREEAFSAQMKALRYQINPHFLFNTLNSIAGLIEEGAATRAECMVLSLSTFMRTTLTLDPMHDVSLADEIALQEEYLEIERERFSDRMTFKIDMPDSVRNALVPSLILQPLIENAVKHGVGATSGPVEIVLSAYRAADRLHIALENDMPHDDAKENRRPGMGVGLRNVEERLSARFQEDAHFSAGCIALGRYRVAMELPWRQA
ncbi:sensor histidine kinase [Methylococcus mesophilus]|uniref:sensor histidine kinase n=1 Tax=Methylococcus mesophilus TaxID=2993564 RepID=UPI00224AFEC8|nr:histidine kinase [Methylococcus mesophilus]UZR28556.1 histidine kinase [Methylococcus mesophilus]